ncbi:aminotransferase class III-fold pyridoxal phosphate-dependent enzyme, partial [Streptomyces violascens]|uniref:aminotransferase class III-fold pyridoxal phosphate-dependent enzyme n=1 Tax=Streptomyces violascens TaxID=67381 RepID=UPI00368B65BF
EDEGFVPELITTSKGIAVGMPRAAVTGRAEIMDSAHGGGLGGTYGGNPVACAAALGAIETMKELDLNGKAKRIEEVMKARLATMAEKYDIIGDIRGRGAMIAIELVKDRASKTPNPEAAGALAKACHAEGLLVLTCGTYGNVLRFLPPLVIGEDLLNEGLDIIEQAFTGV